MTPEAFEFTRRHEGGWYAGNEDRDPNPTMKGVTQRVYDAFRLRTRKNQQSVRLIEDSELRIIYAGYWDSSGCTLVGPLSAITLFDHGFNAGPANAVRILQRAAGVTADGKPGPITRAAIAARTDKDLAGRICFERLRYYINLAKNPRMRPNLLSWAHRVIVFREEFLL